MVPSLSAWRHRALCVVIFALFVASCATAPMVARRSESRASAAAQTDGVRDIGERLEPAIRDAQIPGMVALVLRGDRIVAEGAAGVRKWGTDVAVTIEDQFEICSAAKAMSATVVARLIEQGRLSWDTPVADLFRDAQPAPDPAWRRVTVRQLLEHQAGLKDHLFRFARMVFASRDDAATQRRNYAVQVLSRPPDFAPGSRFLYNNTDYLILGAGLEHLSGRSWTDLMRDELFRPVGLESAGLGPPGKPGEVSQPWGHGGWRPGQIPLLGGKTPFDPGSPQADYPLAAAPAGFVHVAIRDWAKFLTLHLRGDAANPHRAAAWLRPETFDRLHEPEKSGAAYAAGWFTGTRRWAKGPRTGDCGRILYHDGDNGRWTSVAYLAPEIDFAVLIACNRGGMSSAVDRVAADLVGAFAASGGDRP